MKREIVVKFVVPTGITTEDFLSSTTNLTGMPAELVTEGYEYVEETDDTGDTEHNS